MLSFYKHIENASYILTFLNYFILHINSENEGSRFCV